ncbi:hypothetical protein [Jannaschia rubra]|uniref:Uncharacterized protein n=1 Tax=Jannaschia rubra TaxID=282197 RepID=A0A0M6XQE5_9RHOB|nr:hypothetical protein [Jannaschia rubra]CTQ33366.1 hypothetical protein JAN5088_02148 [Jannaschia rubra]SFG00083.1 hypothetical protein SAMN04488517_102194 [Jannaschia rubra]
MTTALKLLTALSLTAIVAGCQAGGDNRVETIGEIEATTDTAIAGDTVPAVGGATQVQP